MLKHARKLSLSLSLSLGAALMAAAGLAQAQTKIAFIDPLSGFLGAVGQHGQREFQFAIDKINAEGGANGKKFELMPLDNKMSPQESVNQLNRAIEQGVRYILQGSSSAVAAALIEAINKHNARSPDKAVLFLNYAAIDPDFTNSRCSFWHFRFDANSDMKLNALVKSMETDKTIKKVFIIGQDYSFGHQVAKTTKELFKKRRPDVQIVGDELHPIGRVKDFSPYVAKIKSAGADTVVTGNWGADLALLIKAAREAGLKVNFYTFYAGVVGGPTAMGEAGIDHVKVVATYSPNDSTSKMDKYITDYKAKAAASDDPYSTGGVLALQMLAKAINQVKSDDPLRVAFALEGMRHEGFYGETQMRASDHQLIQPLFIQTFAKVDGAKVKFPADGTANFGFRSDKRIEGSATVLPTTCVMERPAK